MDGATKSLQTFTEALIQLDVIASIFFCVFIGILVYHLLTSNCSVLYFIEGLHSGNQSQNVEQESLLDHCLIAMVKNHRPM